MNKSYGLNKSDEEILKDIFEEFKWVKLIDREGRNIDYLVETEKRLREGKFDMSKYEDTIKYLTNWKNFAWLYKTATKRLSEEIKTQARVYAGARLKDYDWYVIKDGKLIVSPYDDLMTADELRTYIERILYVLEHRKDYLRYYEAVINALWKYRISKSGLIIKCEHYYESEIYDTIRIIADEDYCVSRLRRALLRNVRGKIKKLKSKSETEKHIEHDFAMNTYYVFYSKFNGLKKDWELVKRTLKDFYDFYEHVGRIL